MQNLWRKTSRHRLVIFFCAMAAAVYCIPLQKYFTLGRYQHYGLAIGLFGMGYLFQTIWSWKVFTHWARMAYLSTSIFSLTVGLTFFYNPWLDSKMALQSRANEQMRPVLMGLYLLLAFTSQPYTPGGSGKKTKAGECRALPPELVWEAMTQSMSQVTSAEQAVQ